MKIILIALLQLIAFAAFAQQSPQNQLVSTCVQPLNATTKATIEKLLSAGADINAPDHEVGGNGDSGPIVTQATCLFAAVATENVEMVSFAIGHGAKVLLATNSMTEYGVTLKQNAFDGLGQFVGAATDSNKAKQSAIVITNVLAASLVPELKGAKQSVDTAVDREGHSLLAIAISYNAVEAASLALASGANVNAMDRDGGTPLMAAIINDSVSMTRLLLSRNASVACTGQQCPILSAVWTDDVALVDLLLGAKADPNSKGNDGEPTLFLACRSAKPPLALITTLVNAGADAGVVWPEKNFNGQVINDKTAIISTIGGNTPDGDRLEIIEYLLKEKKVDPNQGCEGSMTPLALAQYYKLPSIAQLLINYGANPTALKCTAK